MRPSNRVRIIEAAISLAESDGIQAVTIEAVAAASGLTKGGVQYHFASKDILMAGIVQGIWDRFETVARSRLEVPFEEASPRQRLRAYVAATVEEGTRVGEFVIFVDAATSEQLADQWKIAQERWLPAAGELTTAEQLVLLAADGLWMNDVTHALQLSPADRSLLAQQMLRQLDEM